MNDLVGREAPLRQLSDWLAGALGGRASVLFVAGEAGVGKTSLVRSALRSVDVDVVEGVGLEDGDAPYGPVVSALRRLRRVRDPELEGPARAALATLLPELGTPGAGTDRARLFDALCSLLTTSAAERPIVVFLDDLQWADDATLDLLPALARSLEHDAVAVVGTYRSDDLPRGHAIRRARAELRRTGRFQEVVLDLLDANATAELLRRRLGEEPSPSLVATVFDRTDGVPFFVEELAAALSGGGRLRRGRAGLELAGGDDVPVPESVRDAVLVRAAGLRTEAWSAVLAASVAGQEFDPATAAAIAGLDGWPDEPARAGLVVRTGDRMAFRHALVRDACYGEIGWSRRAALHREVAERLLGSGAPPAVVAEHWARGREPELARQSFVAAAEGFRRVHAHHDAVRADRRALDLWPEGVQPTERLEVLEHLAGCAELAGELGEAVATWREAADGWRQRADAERLGPACRRLAAALEMQGRWEEALAAREEAAGAFDAAGSPADAAAERLASGAHLRSAARFRAALDVLERGLADARRAGRVDLETRILGLEGNVRARMGEGEPALELVRSALTTALADNLTGPAAEIYQRLADSLEHAGDYRAARETYDAAVGFCSANALDQPEQLCLACLTVVLRQSGDWERAIALCRRVVASPASSAHARSVATGTLGTILAARGQASRARPLLLESASLARGIELTAMELLSGWGLALDAHLGGSEGSAADGCRGILERWARSEDRHYAISPLRWAATLFAASADAAGAGACVEALGRIASDSPQPEALSALSHAIGETAILDGDPETALTQFAQAIDLLRGVDVPFDRMESERRAAAALASAGRREDAVDRLVMAHRTAVRLKARPFVERIAADLAALGERPNRRLSPRAAGQLAAAGLTRRETEVVRLVAVGRTNREIARELFVSHRTVEMHVQHILAKLDCRTRADAARRATELGLLRGA
jgi:DNA-binding CsgD family transcriptional regulator